MSVARLVLTRRSGQICRQYLVKLIRVYYLEDKAARQATVGQIYSLMSYTLTGADPLSDECSDGSGCCPDGDTCTSTGCCDGDEVQCGPGTCYNPSTEKCCPNGGYCSPGKDCCGYEYCYNPTTEICCSQGQGTCDLGDVCCTNECCPSDGSCASDGYCTANICYETSTYTTTSYATIYKTITEIATPEEEEEAPEFKW